MASYKNSGTRIEWISNLRAMACISIIILHVITNRLDHADLLSTDWYILSGMLVFTRWAVPVFFMMSGMLLLGRKESSDLKWIFRHAVHILVPAVIWGGCYVMLEPVLDIIRRNPLEQYNFAYFTNNIFNGAGYHLWFCFTLGGLYFLIPLMNKIVEDKRTTEYFLVIWVVANFCLPYLPQDIPVISRSIGYLDLKMVTGYAGYMILGYYMVKYSNIEKFISTKLAAVLGILVLAATIICTWLVSAHRNTTVNLAGPLMPSALLLALTVTEIFMKSGVTKKKYKLLNNISDNSFGIYLMHSMVVIRLSYKGIHSVMCTPFIAVPVVTVIVLVICYFATSIIRKIPFVGKWMV